MRTCCASSGTNFSRCRLSGLWNCRLVVTGWLIALSRRLETVGDRIAPVAAEGATRDLHTRRRLPALVFGEIEHAPDAVDHRLRMPARDDIGDRHFLFDQAIEHVVEFDIR